jgi:hypothetical protein
VKRPLFQNKIGTQLCRQANIIKWFLHKSKASLTSKNHIPKQQRLQAATTKYQNFETQNHLLSGDQASWTAKNSHSLLSYLHHHTQTEGLQVKWRSKYSVA